MWLDAPAIISLSRPKCEQGRARSYGGVVRWQAAGGPDCILPIGHGAMRAEIAIPETQLAEFCRKWKIAELRVFGSALREDFRPEASATCWCGSPRMRNGACSITWRLRGRFPVSRAGEWISHRSEPLSTAQTGAGARLFWRARSRNLSHDADHLYEGVDLEEVWTMVTADLPQLVGLIEPLTTRTS